VNKLDNVTVIGISGPARAGKDTTAQFMQQEIVGNTNPDMQNLVVALESWAAPIKSMVAMLLDFFHIGSIMNPAELAPYLDGDKKEEHIEAIGASPRKLMQTLGTDWGRNIISESIWIDSMAARAAMYNDVVDAGYSGAVLIIPDCRFDNEAEFVRSIGGTMLRVETSRELEEVEEHASEGGISDNLIHTVLHNDGTLEDLQKMCVSVLEEILECELNPEEEQESLEAPKEVMGNEAN